MADFYLQKKLPELKERWMLHYLGRSLKHLLNQLEIEQLGTLIETFTFKKRLKYRAISGGGCDFNVDYMTAVLACEYTDGTIHYYNEVRLKNSNTEEMGRKMKAIEPNVEVYPDPAGSARSTTSNRSDHHILRDFGFLIRAKKSHPSHVDRLNALNRKLLDAEGNIGMTVDAKCKYLIKDLEQVQRDKKGGIDKSQIELTHSLDACSYAIAYKFPVISRASTTMKW